MLSSEEGEVQDGVQVQGRRETRLAPVIKERNQVCVPLRMQRRHKHPRGGVWGVWGWWRVVLVTPQKLSSAQNHVRV